ncbi:hypothetical protein CYY_001923 [Polysphondylium violaceum]|uniref:Uncharacterized protein n=1 Tax=Polysphondylium violaceum TaxID=133409 RepID=A0A8J4Q283_9MYCE|nr:hypothetical protein CYY_001923 [Polysphondylium violaceum]
MSSSHYIEFEDVFDDDYLRRARYMAAFGTIMIFVIVVKICYIYLMLKPNYRGSRIKSLLHIFLGIFVLFNIVPLYAMLSSKGARYLILDGFQTFSRNVGILILIICVLLLFLLWVERLEFIITGNNKKRDLSKTCKTLFLLLFFIPNVLLSIVSLSCDWEYDRSPEPGYTSSVKQMTYMKLTATYFLISSVAILYMILWGFLIFTWRILDAETKAKNKSFFFEVFLFSITLLCEVIIFELALYVAPSAELKWVYLVLGAIITAEVVIFLHPVQMPVIAYFLNPNNNFDPRDQINQDFET